MISEKADKMTDLLVGASAAYGCSNSQKMHELLLEAVTQLHTYIAELEAAQRWRVVADGELPEKYRDETGEYIPFLVCEGDGGYPFRARYDGMNWGDGMFVPDITHWMPLPNPPEESER
jgi:hypothetical protein